MKTIDSNYFTNGINIKYKTIIKKVKNLTLKINAYNEIILIKPNKLVSELKLKAFLDKHLYNFYNISKNKKSLKDAISLEDKYYYCFGKKVKIDYDFKTKIYKQNNKEYKIEEKELLEVISDYLTINLLNYLKKRQKFFEDKYKLKISNIKVAKKTVAWATNYYSKNLITYSNNLAFFSYEIIDYVILHELCHNIHNDHSNEFWNLLKQWCENLEELKYKLSNFIFS